MPSFTPNELLMEAANAGDYILVNEAITNQNADANFIDSNDNTPLMLASFNGNADCVRFLIKHTNNLFSRNIYNCTALDLALDERHEKCAQLLTEAEKEQRNKEAFKTIAQKHSENENTQNIQKVLKHKRIATLKRRSRL